MIITTDVIDQVICRLLEAIAAGFLQSLVLFLLILFSMRLLKNRLNAATRYLIWYVFLISIVCLPFVSANFANRNQSAPERIIKGEASNIPESSPILRPQAETKANGKSSSVSAPVQDKTVSHFSGSPQDSYFITLALPKTLQGGWIYILFCFWMLISFWKILQIVLGYRYLQKIKRKCVFLTEHQVRLKQFAGEMNVRRSVRLAVSNDITVPVVAGFRNVIILVPERVVKQLSNADFEQVVLHELAHIRRYDDWTKLGQKLIEAVFFFHPVFYWVRSRLEMEREVACDNWVISITGNRRDYAMCLTALIESFNSTNALSFTPKMFSTSSQIFRRVKLVLDKKRNSMPGLSLSGATIVIAAMTGVIFCCALTFPAIKVKTFAEHISDSQMPPDLDISENTVTAEQDFISPSNSSSERKTSVRLIQNTKTSDLSVANKDYNTEIKEGKKVDEQENHQDDYTPPPIENLSPAEQKDGRERRQGDASTPSVADLRYAERLDKLMRPKLRLLEQKVFSEMEPEMREIETEAYRLSRLSQAENQSQEVRLANERLKQRIKDFQDKADAKMTPQFRQIEAEARNTITDKNSEIQK